MNWADVATLLIIRPAEYAPQFVVIRFWPAVLFDLATNRLGVFQDAVGWHLRRDAPRAEHVRTVRQFSKQPVPGWVSGSDAQACADERNSLATRNQFD
jgi:hypothetical protein